MLKKQQSIFKDSEGDAWFERNKKSLSKKDMSKDPIVLEIENLISLGAFEIKEEKVKILEIGCGVGSRGAFISSLFKFDYYGIDPSRKAIEAAKKKGVIAKIATADEIPFKNNSFDVVVFGFCLYLCDRKDLKKISFEADRVLKGNSWVIIYDFFSEIEIANPYHHKSGIKSYKMDYRKIFDHFGNFFCFSHKVLDHNSHIFTEKSSDWVSISSLRKNIEDVK